MTPIHRLAVIVLVGLLLASVGQNIWYWSQSPDRVATHFDAAGRPDGWMPRTEGALVMGGFQLGVPLFLVVIAVLINRLPPSMVNMPHREFWLHPDRRESTIAYLRHWMTWMAVLVSLFLMGMSHLTFVANRSSDGLNMVAVWVLLAVFLGGVLYMVVNMHRQFRV